MPIPQHMQHEKQDELEGLVSSQSYGIIRMDETWRNASHAGVLGWRAAGRQVRCWSGTVCWAEIWLYSLSVSDGVGV